MAADPTIGTNSSMMCFSAPLISVLLFFCLLEFIAQDLIMFFVGIQLLTSLFFAFMFDGFLSFRAFRTATGSVDLVLSNGPSEEEMSQIMDDILENGNEAHVWAFLEYRENIERDHYRIDAIKTILP